MSKKVFKFRDKSLDLEIAGRDFKIMCDDKLALKLAAMKDKFAEYTDVENVKKKAPEEIIKACGDITDDILGAGAFAGIFSDHTPNIHDCIDVVVFVMNSVGEKYRAVTPVATAALPDKPTAYFKN